MRSSTDDRSGPAAVATVPRLPDPIEIHDLTKRYGSTLAVEALSFRVAEGRIVGFLRTEWCRQDDHAALAARADQADLGTHPDRREALRRGRVGSCLYRGCCPGGGRGVLGRSLLQSLGDQLALATGEFPHQCVEEVLCMVDCESRCWTLGLGLHARDGAAPGSGRCLPRRNCASWGWTSPRTGSDPAGIRWRRDYLSAPWQTAGKRLHFDPESRARRLGGHS